MATTLLDDNDLLNEDDGQEGQQGEQQHLPGNPFASKGKPHLPGNPFAQPVKPVQGQISPVPRETQPVVPRYVQAMTGPQDVVAPAAPVAAPAVAPAVAPAAPTVVQPPLATPNVVAGAPVSGMQKTLDNLSAAGDVESLNQLANSGPQAQRDAARQAIRQHIVPLQQKKPTSDTFGQLLTHLGINNATGMLGPGRMMDANDTDAIEAWTRNGGDPSEVLRPSTTFTDARGEEHTTPAITRADLLGLAAAGGALGGAHVMGMGLGAGKTAVTPIAADATSQGIQQVNRANALMKNGVAQAKPEAMAIAARDMATQAPSAAARAGAYKALREAASSNDVTQRSLATKLIDAYKQYGAVVAPVVKSAAIDAGIGTASSALDVATSPEKMTPGAAAWDITKGALFWATLGSLTHGLAEADQFHSGYTATKDALERMPVVNPADAKGAPITAAQALGGEKMRRTGPDNMSPSTELDRRNGLGTPFTRPEAPRPTPPEKGSPVVAPPSSPSPAQTAPNQPSASAETGNGTTEKDNLLAKIDAEILHAQGQREDLKKADPDAWMGAADHIADLMGVRKYVQRHGVLPPELTGDDEQSLQAAPSLQVTAPAPSEAPDAQHLAGNPFAVAGNRKVVGELNAATDRRDAALDSGDTAGALAHQDTVDQLVLHAEALPGVRPGGSPSRDVKSIAEARNAVVRARERHAFAEPPVAQFGPVVPQSMQQDRNDDLRVYNRFAALPDGTEIGARYWHESPKKGHTMHLTWVAWAKNPKTGVKAEPDGWMDSWKEVQEWADTIARDGIDAHAVGDADSHTEDVAHEPVAGKRRPAPVNDALAQRVETDPSLKEINGLLSDYTDGKLDQSTAVTYRKRIRTALDALTPEQRADVTDYWHAQAGSKVADASPDERDGARTARDRVYREKLYVKKLSDEAAGVPKKSKYEKVQTGELLRQLAEWQGKLENAPNVASKRYGPTKIANDANRNIAEIVQRLRNAGIHDDDIEAARFDPEAAAELSAKVDERPLAHDADSFDFSGPESYEPVAHEPDDVTHDDEESHESHDVDDGFAMHHLFDEPKTITRLNDRVRVFQKDHGWMTPEQAKAKIEAWRTHALAQGDAADAGQNDNSGKVVLSLFDLTGMWSQPWVDAGYQVHRFDIQTDPEMGDVNKFSVQYFIDYFDMFGGDDVHAILAAVPCTEFAVSGARHFAAKDADGRTAAAVQLVHNTLATIEYFKPAVWTIENPVSRIAELSGLPHWRLSFDPNHFGESYTKKTQLWGRFNDDLPLAPVDPVEGSKMHSQYGGKSQKTKNARSATPEGFAYSFFMANNAVDHPAMALANKYDRMNPQVFADALKAGISEDDITNAVDDPYYMDLDDAAAEQAVRDLIAQVPRDVAGPDASIDDYRNMSQPERDEWAAINGHPAPTRQYGADHPEADVAAVGLNLSRYAQAPDDLGDTVAHAAEWWDHQGGLDAIKELAGQLGIRAKYWRSLSPPERHVLHDYYVAQVLPYVRINHGLDAGTAPATDLFGEKVPSTEPAQTGMFGANAGTEGSRPLTSAESAARAELDRLNAELPGLEGKTRPDLRKRRDAIQKRIAELSKLVNRGERIGTAELQANAESGSIQHGQTELDRGGDQAVGGGGAVDVAPGRDVGGAGRGGESPASDATRQPSVPRINPELRDTAAGAGSPTEVGATDETDDRGTGRPGSEVRGATPGVLEREPAGHSGGTSAEGSSGVALHTGGGDSGADVPRADGADVAVGGTEAVRGEAGGAGDLTHDGEQPSDAGDRTGAGARDRLVPANFRIDDATVLHEGGEKARITNNLAAIRLLRALGDRPAMPDEQAVLAKFVGWGALKALFDETSKHSDKYAIERAELRTLLTPDEYRHAEGSTLGAYYTSPEVIRAMWDAMAQLGVRGPVAGLEPAGGIGHFLGIGPSNVTWTMTELDPLSAAIAGKLYPRARVEAKGFQEVSQRGHYDLVVGNPPFGDYGVADREYDQYNLRIHDYFFVKALDQLRPGGILAFVTSHYTMDKMNSAPRKAMAERGDFLGAVRLPNTAFAENAGTHVVTDILFFQRPLSPTARAKAVPFLEAKPVKVGAVAVPINEYFVAHPENVLGTATTKNGMYGKDTYTVAAFPEQKSPAALLTALRKQLSETLPHNIYTPLDRDFTTTLDISSAPAKLGDGSLIVKPDGTVWQNHRGTLLPFKVFTTRLDRVQRLIALREAHDALIALQVDPARTEADLAHALAGINRLYDAFVQRHGYINKLEVKETKQPDGTTKRTVQRPNLWTFDADPRYPVVASLEKYDEHTGIATKQDVLLKRVRDVMPEIVSVPRILDAIPATLSKYGRLDLPYMAQLANATATEVADAIRGEAFEDPVTGDWTLAERYLAGDVKTKLAEAKDKAKRDASFDANVNALVKVQPEDVRPADIWVKIGSAWVPPEDYGAFASYVFHGDVTAQYVSAAGGEWVVRANDKAKSSAGAQAEFGTNSANGLRLFSDALNQRDTEITYKDSEGRSHKDAEATMQAQQKQAALKQRFAEWVWEDEKRATRLSGIYNERHNRFVKPTAKARYLEIPNTATSIRGKKFVWSWWQLDSIHAMVSGLNYLLAHTVGAGKTYAMIAAGMEMKRLGVIKKAMYTVPNHMLRQWASEFQELYPGARTLIATKRDFAGKRRREFTARIASGDWDAVIITHSAFGKIGVSAERQKAYITEQLDALRDIILEAGKNKTDKQIVRALQSALKRLEAKLGKLATRTKKDDLMSFEDLGVDQLFVDEAHEFKNGAIISKMRGMAREGSGKAFDLFMKTQYLNSVRPGKGIVFATGTPISNSMVELYTLQMYLQPDALKAAGIQNFDQWAATFGDSIVAAELAPDGSGYRAKTRFARFMNLPELLTMYRQVADVKTAEDIFPEEPGTKGRRPAVLGAEPKLLTTHIPNVAKQPEQKLLAAGDKSTALATPEAGRPAMVVTPKPFALSGVVKWLIRRGEAVQAKQVAPDEDNFLAITTAGRLAAMDLRLISPHATATPNSKVEAAADRISALYKEWHEHKGTQLVFSDIGTPKKESKRFTGATDEEGNPLVAYIEEPAEDTDEDENESQMDDTGGGEVGSMGVPGFSVYDELKEMLIERGIPAREIAYIHDAKDDTQKQQIMDKVKSGAIRVLIGSTAKMGAGMNVQDRIVGLHHLDAPWRPSDLEQREGRAIRQGNLLWEQNIIPGVYIGRYSTEGSFDAYMWQTLERKLTSFKPVLRGDASVRQIEDIGKDQLDLAEMKAATSGNPLVKEKMDVDTAVIGLEAAERAHRDAERRVKGELIYLSQQKTNTETYLNGVRVDAGAAKAVKMTGDDFKATVGTKTFTDRDEANTALRKAIDAAITDGGLNHREVTIGKFGAFPVVIGRNGEITSFDSNALKTHNAYSVYLEGAKQLYPTVKFIAQKQPESPIRSLIQLYAGFQEVVEKYEAKLADLAEQRKGFEAESGKPFKQAEKLTELRQRQAELAGVLGEQKKDTQAPVVEEGSKEFFRMLQRGEWPYRERETDEGAPPQLPSAQDNFSIEDAKPKQRDAGGEKDEHDDDGDEGYGGGMGATSYSFVDPFTPAVMLARSISASYRKRKGLAAQRRAPLVTLSPDVEAAAQRAEGGIQNPAIMVKVKAALAELAKERHHFREINPREGGDKAIAHELLLENQGAPRWAQTVAHDELSHIIEGLHPNEVQLFTRVVAWRDMVREAEDMGLASLPFTYEDPADLADDLATLEQEASQHPKIAAALAKRDAFVTTLTEDLVDAELLPAESLEDQRYYHRQVLAYFNVLRPPTVSARGSDARERRHGYQRARSGSDEDFNLKYVQAEYEWVSQALADLKAKETLAKLKTFDQVPLARTMADQTNLRNLGERLAVSDGISRNDPDFDMIASQSADDALKPYRTAKAIARSQILRLAAQGTLNAGNMQYVADDLADKYQDHKAANAHLPTNQRAPFRFDHPQWFPFLATLAKGADDAPGTLPARAFFKAMKDQRVLVQNTLGRDYIGNKDYRTFAGMVGPNHVTWQPEKGLHFYRAQSVEESILDAAIAGTRALTEADIREVRAVAGMKETWVIPDWLAKTLDDLGGQRYRATGTLDHGIVQLLGTWKLGVLFVPTRVLKYMTNNLSGDLDAVIAFQPKILSEAPKAARDLFYYMYRRTAPKGMTRVALERDMQRMIELRILDAGMSAHEIPDIEELFPQLVSDPVTYMSWLATTGSRYLKWAKTINNFRENILRLAAMRYLEPVFKNGHVVYGPSVRQRVDAETDPTKRAAIVARDLLGAYDEVSGFTQYTRQRNLPFFSFQEVNAKRYINMMRNIKADAHANPGQGGRLAGVAAFKTGKQAAKVALLVNAFLILASLWNNLFFQKEEQELRRRGRQALHVIFGRRKDGSIITVRAEGAFSDFLQWLAIDDYPDDVREVMNGETSVGDKMTDIAMAPVNKVVQMWEPFTKTTAELMFKRSSYPDVTRPTPIRNRSEHAARMFAANGVLHTMQHAYDATYTAVTGKPMVTEKPTPPGGLADFFTYRTDPGEAAYYDLKAKTSKWQEDNNKERFGGDPTEKSNALYYYKRSLQWGDQRLADKWWGEYTRLGGSTKGMRESVKLSAPLGGMKPPDKAAFMETLKPADKAELQMAQDWFARVYTEQAKVGGH